MTKKFLINVFAAICILTGFFSCGSAPLQMDEPKLTYTYAKLKLLDLDQMMEIVQNRLKRYKKTGQQKLVEEAIKISLSRPNDDALAEKLIDTIRFSVESVEIWEIALENVMQQSIAELKIPTTAAEDQLTHLILLETLASEFRPQFIKQYQSPKFESRVIETIAQADIQVSSAAMEEGRLNMMKEPVSPSTLAQSLLNERNQKLNPKK